MASAVKKSRRPIGSMTDTQVPETQNEKNNNVDSDSDESLSNINVENSDTPISSSDEGDHDETENSDDDTNGQEIVRRGPTKLGFEWGTGKVMQLELNSSNLVVGNNAVYFSSQLGILAKDGNKLPLSYTDWRAVPNAQKDLVWVEVKENTSLPDSYKKNCMKKLGKLWKDWKNRLKAKYYTPYRRDKTVLSKCPPRVEADQWPVLVNYWSSKNAKKLSKTNSNSRKHIKLPPRLGRKDMANAIEEYRKEYGHEPSKLDLFVYTRQNKSGKPVDKDTEDKIALLNDLKKKLPENLRDDIAANDEIFEDVIGNEAPGCLRSSIVASKSKNVTFTSREEFDRAVQEKSNEIVASIRKGFEEEMSKFKDHYASEMEMVHADIKALQGRNEHVSGSFNSRRIQAFNNGASSQGFQNLEISSQENGTPDHEMGLEMDISAENNTNIHLDNPCLKEQERSAARKNKKQRK